MFLDVPDDAVHTSTSVQDCLDYAMDGKDDTTASMRVAVAFAAVTCSISAAMALTEAERAVLRKPTERARPELKPTLVLTGVPHGAASGYEGFACHRKQTVMCCEHCGVWEAEMQACPQCEHSHFCSTTCAQAAWPHHRHVCDNLAMEAEILGAVQGRPRFCHECYLFHLLNPDRILPTRFWARLLIGVLRPDNSSDWPGRCVAMHHLSRLLWLFTGHTLGPTLLLTLMRTLGELVLALEVESPKLKAAAAPHQRVVDKNIHALVYVLTCDQLALQLWTEDFPGLPPRHMVPDFPSDPGEDAALREHLLRFMSMDSLWPRGYVNLPFELQGPEVAHVAVVMSLRGVGLVASAFGAVHDGHPIMLADGSPSTQHGACRLELNDTLRHWLGTRWSSPAFGHSLIAELLLEPGRILPRPPADRAAPVPPEARRRYAAAPAVMTGTGLPRPPCPRDILVHVETEMRRSLLPLEPGGGRHALVATMLHLGADLLKHVRKPRIPFSADLADEIVARGPGYLAAMEFGVRHLQSGLPLYNLLYCSKMHEIDVAALPASKGAPKDTVQSWDLAHGVVRDVPRESVQASGEGGRAGVRRGAGEGTPAPASGEGHAEAPAGSSEGVQSAKARAASEGEGSGDEDPARPWLQSLNDTMTRLWMGESSDAAPEGGDTGGKDAAAGGAGNKGQGRGGRRRRRGKRA